MPEVRLVYFDIRGLAEPIRWMLRIAGQPFVDERIPLNVWKDKLTKTVNAARRQSREPTDIRRSSDGEKRLQTDSDKAEKRRNSQLEKEVNLKSWVGQLPILYIDDFELSQVHTVIRFIAKKYGFDGTNLKEISQAEEALELIYDLRLCAVAYNDCIKSDTPEFIRHTVFRDFKNEPDHPKKEFMRMQVAETHIPNYFRRFALLIEQNKGKFICGDRMTYADLALANFLDIIMDLIDPDCLVKFPALQILKDEVFSIPEIKEIREAQKTEGSEYACVG